MYTKERVWRCMRLGTIIKDRTSSAIDRAVM